MKKHFEKLRNFWKHNINPITGWKPQITIGKRKGLPTYHKTERDQSSQFKPRGFR